MIMDAVRTLTAKEIEFARITNVLILQVLFHIICHEDLLIDLDFIVVIYNIKSEIVLIVLYF